MLYRSNMLNASFYLTSIIIFDFTLWINLIVCEVVFFCIYQKHCKNIIFVGKQQ